MKDRAIGEIRFVATIMIVILHMDDFLRIFGKNMYANYFLDAGVGIFFAISGYLYGQKRITNFKKWYLGAFFKIVFPAFLFEAFAAVLNRFFFGGGHDIKSVLASLFGFQYVIENGVGGCYHLWFITYIFACYLITPLLERLNDHYDRTNKNLILEFAKYAVIMIILCSYKVVGLSAYYILQYSLFYMFGRHANEQKNELEIVKKLLVIGGIVLAVVWCVYTYYKFDPLPLGSIIKKCQSQFEVGTSSAMFILMYVLLSKVHANSEKRYGKFLILSDRYSFGVYIVNYYVLFHSAKLTFAALNIPLLPAAVLTFAEIIVIGIVITVIYSPVKKIVLK